MRQRNTSGTAVVVPAIPAEVEPVEEVDHPVLIAGFEPVETAPPTKPPKKTPVKEAPIQPVDARTATVEE